MRESKLTTNLFTVMKMVLVSFMIIAGFSAFRLSNLSIDDDTTAFVEDDVDSSGTYIIALYYRTHDMTWV